MRPNPSLQKIGRWGHHQSVSENGDPIRHVEVRRRWGKMEGATNFVAQIFVKSRGPPRVVPMLAPLDKMIRTVDNNCKT